jgi:integrase
MATVAMKKTPAPGIHVLHSRSCPARRGGTCGKPCRPKFQAHVWDGRSTRTLADGTQVRGVRIRKQFDTLAAAKGWRTEALVALRRGTLKAPARTTLREAALVWIEAAEQGTVLNRSGRRYKPSALRGYRADLEHYILPRLGHVRFSDVRRRDVQALADEIVGVGLSASKVRNVLMPLRAIFRRALEDDELAVSPMTHLRLPAVTGVRDRIATPAEAAALIAALPDGDRALWATAFYAGLRRGELRGLRWDDVDLAAGTIHVRRGWDDYEGEIETKSVKGDRKVPIAGTLRDYLDEQKSRTIRSGADLVFGSTAAAPFTPSAVRKRAQRAWKIAREARSRELAEADGWDFDTITLEQRAAYERQGGLAPIGLHECRHTYVSIMHDAGLSLERIGDYVGHSSSYMTDRYRHLLDGHEKQAAELLDAYLARAEQSSETVALAEVA